VVLHRQSSASPRYPDLSAAQPYFVIGIEAGDLRILNDRGRPFLYPADLFDVLNGRRPADWVTEFGAEVEEYAYPGALNRPGFFEDFFDQNPEQISAFWHTPNQTLAKAA
jgi:hypothetical protein